MQRSEKAGRALTEAELGDARAQAATMREALDREHTHRKRATVAAQLSINLQIEKRREAEEMVVCMQEETGKNELVVQRVREENARAQKRKVECADLRAENDALNRTAQKAAPCLKALETERVKRRDAERR